VRDHVLKLTLIQKARIVFVHLAKNALALAMKK
jgi:hypothetical protein